MRYEPAIDFGDEGHDCGSKLSESYEADADHAKISTTFLNSSYNAMT